MLRITCYQFCETPGDKKASMRPQRNAADNAVLGRLERIVMCASMRPQRNAADNMCVESAQIIIVDASMRPQRNAADND